METMAEAKRKYSGLTENDYIELIVDLQAKVSKLQLMFFSSRREKLRNPVPGEQPLFKDFEEIAVNDDSPDDDKGETPVKGHTRKNKGGRKPLPDSLPRVDEVIDIPEAERFCEVHGCELLEIGETVSERLNYVPAVLEVLRRREITRKCPCCEENAIVTPEKPKDAIPGSIATPSLLAQVVGAKFVEGMPLYRQSRTFQRLGINLPRSTLARWLIHCGQLVQPLLNCMHEDLLSSAVAHCDETTVQVLKEADKKAQSKSFMWVLARQGEEPIVLFRYDPSRSQSAGMELLSGFEGTLHCDGYRVYDNLAAELDFKLQACFAHVRRNFWQAVKQALKDGQSKAKILASKALSYINRLFEIEADLKDKPPDEIMAGRKKKSKPIIESLLAWLNAYALKVLPSSLTGKAIAYALGQWEKLTTFLDDPAVSIHNNYVESAIRPFVVGRKAWLFADTVKGAEAAAALISLIESAKKNNLEPFDYLKLVFKELPKAETADDIYRLLPYHASKHFQLKHFPTSL